MIAEDLMPGILFQELMRERHNAVLAGLAAQGLSDLGAPMILFVLKHYGHGGEVAVQRELSDALHVSPATVAVSLKSLERGGYVEKRPDAADARRKRIALTPKGAEAVKLCREVFRTVDDRMLDGLSAQESGQLTGYLRRMLYNLSGHDRPRRHGERKNFEW